MMKKYAKMMMAVLLFVALMPLATGSAAETEAPAAQSGGPYNCFPTCSEIDGRFLVIPGSDRETLTGQEIEIQFAAPAGADALEIGIFDGDSESTDTEGKRHWDIGTAPIDFTLYADPAADGSGFEVIGTYDGSAMPDNDWFTIEVPTGPEARAPSGHYFYRLRAELRDTTTDVLSSFKLRTDGVLMIRQQPFSFEALFTRIDDIGIIYPDYPDSFESTTYDGTFTFFMDAPQEQRELAVWDGDLDRGKYDGTEQDTDDPDTPNDRVPLWTVEDARFEGKAVGSSGSTGAPSDDIGLLAYNRTPSVRYEIVAPDGQVFANENPSGNREWEQFKISTEPFDRSEMDYHADSLPPGNYKVELKGMDMFNLNAWRFPNMVLCVDDSGNACEPLRPYVVGDTVWYDGDRDGVQDANEDGISGVTVNLLDSNGNVMETTTTDADGKYRFEVEFGTYTVQIAGDNFNNQGDPLYELTSTTGGEEQTRGIGLDYDFGYVYDNPGGASGSLGDRVWLDLNGDGVQDAGEPGIDGAVVNLYYDFDGDGDLDLIASDTTKTLGPLGAGYYGFDQLDAGTYVVTVKTSTLPGDLVQTYDLDGTLDDSTTVTLEPDDVREDVDFGYEDEVCCPCLGSIGDTVWNDENGNGVQDGGEPGIPDVGVMLTFGDYAIMTTTDENGEYLFKNLDPGMYMVSVDEGTLGSLTEATYDYDGTDTPHMAAVTLAEGESNLEVDFGYQEIELAPVKPILECVADNQDGTYTAYFGYLNENDFAVTIPVGDENKFSPTPQDRGQPTTFEAGRTPYWPDAAFGVEFDGNNLVWTLDGRTATANSGSTPCSHHVFLEKEWYDQDGNPLDQPPAEVTGFRQEDARHSSDKTTSIGVVAPGFTIEASSDLGTAICSYDDDMNLVCSYDNQAPALDDNGLWVPVGTDYEVTEYGLPAGWSAGAGVGTFTQGDGYCVGGRDGMEKYCTHTVENVSSPCLPVIDLETDAYGNPLEAGDLIAEQWADWGVHVSTNDPDSHPLMIFDSANPTGNDDDLGTPNEDFGGPGVGGGGGEGEDGENSKSLNNVLIISKDGDTDDPDDYSGGGTITFDFDFPVQVDAVDILDIDDGDAVGTVKAYNASGNEIASADMSPLGENSYQRVAVNAVGVSQLEITFPGSGAVAGIEFCIEPGCWASDGCTTFTFLGAVEDGDETTLTWEITNDCDKGLSYAAFGLPDDVLPIGFDDEDDTYTYDSPDGHQYQVEKTNYNGQPGFPSIKFNWQSGPYEIKDGASDVFEYTLNSSDYDPSEPIQVQMKAGPSKYTITLVPDDC
jgi:hypothetical protein